MGSNKKNDTTQATENEIRKGRRYNLADAIGRAGAGNLKGASPIPLSRQALMELETTLTTNLTDPPGSLVSTLVIRLGQNLPLLDKHRDAPDGALRELLAGILSSESALLTLVRDTDARWGRQYQEKPHFNHPDQPDSPEDPYTPDGVRQALTDLLGRL